MGRGGGRGREGGCISTYPMEICTDNDDPLLAQVCFLADLEDRLDWGNLVPPTIPSSILMWGELESLCCDLVVFLTVTTSSSGIPCHLGVMSEVTLLEARTKQEKNITSTPLMPLLIRYLFWNESEFHHFSISIDFVSKIIDYWHSQCRKMYNVYYRKHWRVIFSRCCVWSVLLSCD